MALSAILGFTLGAFTMIAAPTKSEAGILSSLRSSGWETKSTKHYKLEVMNFDVRVYEWTPEYNKDIKCVFVAGGSNSTGVACYPIKK